MMMPSYFKPNLSSFPEGIGRFGDFKNQECCAVTILPYGQGKKDTMGRQKIKFRTLQFK